MVGEWLLFTVLCLSPVEIHIMVEKTFIVLGALAFSSSTFVR